MKVDHFAVLGLAPTFDLDAGDLAERYRRLQAVVHPDRHASASAGEQRIATERALAVNAAYRCLRDPVARALHLLALDGIDALAEGNTVMTEAFLGTQIGWRERMAEAEGDAATLEALRQEMASALDQATQRFAGAWPHDKETAACVAREMRFIERQLDAIDAELAATID